MSHKAFYQTFFQTEQLFRRADDALVFPVLAPAVEERPVIEVAARAILTPDPVSLPPAVSIIDPVLPAPVEEFTPAADVLQELEQDLVAAPAVVVVPAVAEVIITPESAPVPQPEAVAEPVSAFEPVMVAEPANAAPAVQPPVTRRPATPLLSQKVLILVDEDLQPSDRLFLEKILKAVHLDVTGVDLLNVHGTANINFSDVLADKAIDHFFTFGVPFSRINLDIMMDQYHPVRFNGVTFLMANPLPAIEADVALKKKLWEALKKVFLWR